MMNLRGLCFSLSLLVVSACQAKTDEVPPFSYQDTRATCSALTNLSPELPGMEIASAQPLPATDTLPAFCQVTGTINPNIGFEARYPLTDWNGKYFQSGCGGFCGVVLANKEGQSNAINYALRKGYATITTDAGHQGQHIGDGRWAKDNPEAEAVYAHKTIPLTFAAGHLLVNALYSSAPTYSYFSGCSNGGRMGAIAAQRYPDLFDGIVVGCPVLNLSVNGGVFGAWVLQSNQGEDGRPILDVDFLPKLPMLEAAVLAQCDSLDGATDGIISEPQSCTPDLARLETCGETETASCLTAQEKTVISKWYQGARNSQGEAIFHGMSPGSERYWGFWYIGDGSVPGAGTLLADGYGAYLGFPEDPKDYSALDFNFDTDVDKLAEQGKLFNALNPDLRAFKAFGGKMIMWHGMADPLVLPDQSPAYYRAVEMEMGGYDAVQTFFRLFMAPGLGHCWEAPASAPDQMDVLGALENWVENGIAPETIEVTQYDKNADKVLRKGTLRPFPQTETYSTVLSD